MANLLAKLRINYTSLTMVEGVFEKPKESTINSHTRLLEGFWEGQNDQCFISDVEREKQREKTYLHLRLREILRQHSLKASLIVMSLPMPRQVRIFVI
jgi:solute carrier family 12 (sodium/potassium/chloride transporter), member 2